MNDYGALETAIDAGAVMVLVIVVVVLFVTLFGSRK